MKFLNFDRVVCLSPHPDDVEYSMSATIAKYTDTHFDLVCMSYGGEDDPTSGIPRIDEVIRFWSELHLCNVTLKFYEGFISQYNESKWISKLENQHMSPHIQCIITPSSKDAHFEHKIINSTVAPMTRKSPVSIIEYKSPSTTGEWIPNLFVDLTEEMHIAKVELLRKHFTTQTDAPYFEESSIRAFHTDFSSVKRGLSLVEMFRVVQIYSPSVLG